MKKANDDFADYHCTTQYHRFYSLMLLTDGAKALADKYECYWFLDIINSHQTKKLRLKTGGFQVWKLRKTPAGGFKITCDDGNGNICIVQHGSYTSFEPDYAELWVEPLDQLQQVVLLPSEH